MYGGGSLQDKYQIREQTFKISCCCNNHGSLSGANRSAAEPYCVWNTFGATRGPAFLLASIILPANHWFSEWLHNQMALAPQRNLHLNGIPLVIFPIKLIFAAVDFLFLKSAK
jgi:hypothetical protein